MGFKSSFIASALHLLGCELAALPAEGNMLLMATIGRLKYSPDGNGLIAGEQQSKKFNAF